MRKPKKFDLVHQTVSPRERVGSGDETSIFTLSYIVSKVTCKLIVGDTA